MLQIPIQSSGSTNLTCPTCRQRVGPLAFQTLDPAAVGISDRIHCPSCGTPFWPESGFLLTFVLHERNRYFGIPLSLGGTQKRDYTDVSIGKTRRSRMHSLYDGYELEKIGLRGAHRTGVDREDWLDLNPLHNPYTQASLGGEVLISLAQISPTDIAISANLQENRPEAVPLSPGDTIDILYDATMQLIDVVDPPWLLNLREAEAAIRRRNTVPALPLLISAFDNLLYRQVYLLLRNRGIDEQDAVDRIETLAGGRPIRRKDLAKDVLDALVGERLTDGRYATEWAAFMQLKNDRNQIVHPTGTASVDPPTQANAIDAFNQTVEMMLYTFNLCWDV